MSIENKRRQNEKKFGSWEDMPHGGCRYFFEVPARYGGWSARYVKETDTAEQTIRFYQEIYDNNGRLTEIHEKYPDDKGHIRIREEDR